MSAPSKLVDVSDRMPGRCDHRMLKGQCVVRECPHWDGFVEHRLGSKVPKGLRTGRKGGRYGR